MTVLYDPPSGWRFGFPKPYEPSNPLEPIEHTLRRDGYPDELLAQGLAKYCRFMGSDEELEGLPDAA